MGYHASLQSAERWLLSHQNTDGGWGLSHKQPSSLVNTAESVIVLNQVDASSPGLLRGIQFLTSNFDAHVQKYGPRIRYAAFSLMALNEQTFPEHHPFRNRVAEWLVNAQNGDGGWGNESLDGNSRIFSTSLALLALQKFYSSDYREAIEAGVQYLLAHRGATGWNFEGNTKQASPTATAIATLACIDFVGGDNEIFESAHLILKGVSHWNTEPEPLPGTAWQHSTYHWIIPALLRLEETPYSITIAQFVRSINHQQFDGGWTEPDGSKTIRGQFWAIAALSSIQRSYDPVVDTYRIDSERTQQALREPEFVNIKVHSKYAMVFPARMYKAAAYSFLFGSMLVLLGQHRKIELLLNEKHDFLLAWVIATPFLFFVKARKRLFPVWIWRALVGVLIVSTILEKMWGWSVSDISSFLEYVKNYPK